jgi:hypothetical protein
MMAGMPMMMDMEQLKQQMGHMSMEQINAMALPGGQPARGRHGNVSTVTHLPHPSPQKTKKP